MARKRIRLKYSRSASLVGAIVGFGMAFIGLVVVVPLFSSAGEAMPGMGTVPGSSFPGVFAKFWTFVAFVIGGYHLYNFLTGEGGSMMDVEVESQEQPGDSQPGSVETRLRELEKLRQRNLITVDEYQQKREQILREI